jgi:twitching motility protein PilT
VLLRSEEAGKKLAQWEKKLNEITAQYENVVKHIKESSKIAEDNYNKVNLAIKLVNQLEERTRGFAVPFEESSVEEKPKSDLDFSLDDLLHVMIKHHASDLHLKVGTPPTVRLDGELIPIGEKILLEEDCQSLILSALTPALKRKLHELKEVDFAYHLPEARFRVNAFYQRNSLSASFRMLRYEIPGIEELGLPPVLKDLAANAHGLIIITGPAGCGKSTTLASMIDYINSTRKVHIITIEDPIEYVHSDKLSMVTQREVGADTPTFASGLKQALRQDPNVILIGEMRDPETIMTAAMAAETGHLVLTTLHAANTSQAIDRITDIFSGEALKQIRLLLANNLKGIVSQRLLSRADGEGRVPATEVMVVTPTISALILEGKTNEIYPYLVQGGTEGMQTFTASLIKLYEAGKITKEEALRNADSPNEFRLALEGHTTSTNLVEDTLSSWL